MNTPVSSDTVPAAPKLTVDIWTDVNCPFCYLGKARFTEALSDFAGRDGVSVVHRSFELDPTLPPETSGPVIDHIATKYGISTEQAAANERGLAAQAAELGLPYQSTGRDFGNSFDMHRLLHFAHTRGRQEVLLDALYAANFADERPVFGDRAALLRVAVDAGFDADEVRGVLDDPDAYAAEVRADEQQAAALGITGVPFFVFGGKYAVSGAQPAEVFAEALRRASDDRIVPIDNPDGGDAACGPEGCAVPER